MVSIASSIKYIKQRVPTLQTQTLAAEREETAVPSFHDFFDMVPATTRERKLDAYRLRYQVYCEEAKFFDPKNYPDRLEIDEYDAFSEHFLIRHRETRKYAATARLILPDPDCPERPFPIELNARIDKAALPKSLRRARIAEASRFCVSKDFKRRRGESGTQAGLQVSDVASTLEGVAERRTFPHITVALLACLVRMSIQNNITHWYGFMEAPLIRLFRSLGICWTQIGPVCEYYGKRTPCIIQIPEHLEPTRARDPNIWDMLTDSGRFWRIEPELERRDDYAEGSITTGVATGSANRKGWTATCRETDSRGEAFADSRRG